MPARILVIEDNPDNLELMTYLLKAFGHVPWTACDGDAGIALAREQKPDLIVCDIQLPGMDGYDVARRIKADTTLSGVPLVAVTALAMVGDRDKVLAAGFDGYIPKPIDPEIFVQNVERFLSSREPSAPSLPVPNPSPFSELREPSLAATIRVVDDLSENRMLKRSILEPTGYTVLTADTMSRALELARQAPPDLILSDVNMADGTGFEFIRQVKADPRLKHIPFVFITSTSWDTASQREGLALGAARYLFRPIEPQQLLAEIDACLNEHGRR
jgi:two-component system cell cycle response regulator